MTQSNTQQPKATPDGLPDIASEATARKPYALASILVVISLSILLITYKVTHPTTSGVTRIEEHYTAQPATTDNQASPVMTPKEAVSHNDASPTPASLSEEQKQLVIALEKERQARLQAPLMSISNTTNVTTTPTPKTASTDTNTQFMEHLSTQNEESIKATLVGDRRFILSEGTLIHGVMESAIDSDLPGMLRAIVAEPVYADDASRVLIEAGSRLIGQYKSGMQQGQARVFVVWTTLIQPSGSRINLASPGVDNRGVSGSGADSIDRHFLERFGTSGLLSIIGAGAANLGVNNSSTYNAAQAYRQAIAQSFTESAKDAYQQNGGIPPTLHIEQGKPIIVFVAHPLDFTRTVQQTTQKRSIF
jgi:type IV secretion system protein VirB10